METEWTFEDPIDEIYAIRAKISAKYGHDVHKIFEAVAEQQRIEEAKGRRYVRLPIARTAPTPAMA